jgi:AraC-like DNA-binding protein
VAFSTDHVGDELLESINRAFQSLPELADALMRALADRTQFVAGSMRLFGVGTLTLGRAEGRLQSDWRSEGAGMVEGRAGWPERPPPAPGRAALPILYADALLGEILIELGSPLRPNEAEAELLRHFARHAALLVKRYEVRRWSEQRLGRPLLLVGMSRALREIESFVEISARRRLPVLLRGEFGTEKTQLAATIHCCSPSADGPFVQIDCAEPASAPADWIGQAEGGTLFLSDVDELDPRLQKQLPQHLPSRLHQWLPAPDPRKVRIIASTSSDLHERARQGLFSRTLLAELDFLSVTVPPLRDRAGDIEPLICEALARNGYAPEEKRTDILVALCRAHLWPDNLFELERTIARLAVMTESRPIRLGDICRHAPEIVPHDMVCPEGAEGDGAPLPGLAERWVEWATSGGRVPSRGLHEGLKRALLHLGAHYDDPISLPQLASHAGVSPSHLGFLFRNSVGMSFKALLGHIRIHKAREALASEGRPNITEVAMRVGFSDLSHFERSFRRIVGQSPREYRRALSLR